MTPDASGRLNSLPPAARRAACEVLDEISRPLTPREIEDALVGVLSRKHRRALTYALKGVSIIAIREDA